jgi:hypothetical protein
MGSMPTTTQETEMTDAPTVTLYEIGQNAEDYAEFIALRGQLLAADPDAIAQTDLGGSIDLSTIVTDHVSAWGGFAEDGGAPMTNAEVVAYLDHSIAEASIDAEV